ncbi:MAG TPA: S-4TM family putative pore-forming effector [Actinocrinis sp.]|nr:S-4TM family putative pore-forming effector [Actinocrinis sp.]
MAGTQRIARLQESSRSIDLLRAIAVAHGHTQFAQMTSLLISVLVAGLSIMTQLVPAAALALAGAVWAFAYALLITPWRNRYLRTSAALQEMFDIELFKLPWNRVMVGDPVPEHEVSRLSRHYRGNPDRLRGYYLVADVPEPYDVLFCIEQNLAWGSRIRRRFANILITIAILWFGIGIAVAFADSETVGRLVSTWFVPALGLLLLCLDTFRAQVSVAQERTRVLSLVHAVGADPASPVLASTDSFAVFARHVQDVLFQTRLQQPRVPQWFFLRFHDNDMADFRYKMQTLEEQLANAGPVAPAHPAVP